MTIKDFKKELEKYDENLTIKGIADGAICDFSELSFDFSHCWEEDGQEVVTIWVTENED